MGFNVPLDTERVILETLLPATIFRLLYCEHRGIPAPVRTRLTGFVTQTSRRQRRSVEMAGIGTVDDRETSLIENNEIWNV